MKRKLVIYILVLAVLAAVYFAITKIPHETAEKKTPDYKILEGFEINSAEIENGYGKYKLTYIYPDWMMDDKKVKGEYMARLSGIKSSLKMDSSDLKAFGLDDPVSKVTLTDGKGAVKTLTVGDFVPDKSGRYVMCDGIYAVSNEYISWLTENKDIFRSRELFSEASPKRIEFNGICFEIVDGAWQMTSPYRHGVRGPELKSEVLDNLSFTAVDFTDKPPDECGLDPPKGYISVWDQEDRKTTVFFGDKADGLIYAMREDDDGICRIGIPDFLEKSPVYFLNKLCYVKNIDEIDSINVNGMLFDISDGYKKDGRVIEKEDFIEFYKQLMGMTLIDAADNFDKNELILRMEVSFKDGKKDTVEVYKYNERYGAVFINGVCEFYTLGGSAEEIVSQAEKL